MMRVEGKICVLFECPHCAEFEIVSLSKINEALETFTDGVPVITECNHCDRTVEVTPRNG